VSDATPDDVQVPEVDLEAFEAAWRSGATVLDVRNPDEYEDAHVPGAVLVPLPELGDRLAEVPEGRPLYVICARGGRSMTAAKAMKGQLGWDVVNVGGGTLAWQASGRPVVGGAEPGQVPGA
jgi:rhodanese-related sulfurtransferase